MSTSGELRRLKRLLLDVKGPQKWAFKWDVLRGDMVRLRPEEIEDYLNGLAEKKGTKEILQLLRDFFCPPDSSMEERERASPARRTAIVLACLEMDAAAKLMQLKSTLDEEKYSSLVEKLELWV